MAKVDFLVWNRPDKHLANNYATVSGMGDGKKNATPAESKEQSGDILGSKVEAGQDAQPEVDEEGNPINAEVQNKLNSSDSNPSDCE